jgi:hypothetical protein
MSSHFFESDFDSLKTKQVSAVETVIRNPASNGGMPERENLRGNSATASISEPKHHNENSPESQVTVSTSGVARFNTPERTISNPLGEPPSIDRANTKATGDLDLAHWESVDEGLFIGISKLFGEDVADYLSSTGIGKRPSADQVL